MASRTKSARDTRPLGKAGGFPASWAEPVLHSALPRTGLPTVLPGVLGSGLCPPPSQCLPAGLPGLRRLEARRQLGQGRPNGKQGEQVLLNPMGAARINSLGVGAVTQQTGCPACHPCPQPVLTSRSCRWGASWLCPSGRHPRWSPSHCPHARDRGSRDPLHSALHLGRAHWGQSLKPALALQAWQPHQPLEGSPGRGGQHFPRAASCPHFPEVLPSLSTSDDLPAPQARPLCSGQWVHRKGALDRSLGKMDFEMPVTLAGSAALSQPN